MIEHFRKMTRYASWANEHQMAACGELSPDELKRSVGASFGTIFGTLNHLLLADTLWLHRLKREPFTPPASMAEEVWATFEALGQARTAFDKAFVEYLDLMPGEALEEDLTFASIALQREFTMPVNLILSHIFNHQSYHRGQISLMLRQAGHKPPGIDLLWYPD